MGADSLLWPSFALHAKAAGGFSSPLFPGPSAWQLICFVVLTCSGWGFHIPPPCRMLSWTGHWGLRLQSSPLLIGWPSGAFINWAFSLASHSLSARRGVKGRMILRPPSLSSQLTCTSVQCSHSCHSLKSHPCFFNQLSIKGISPKTYKSKSSKKTKSCSCFLAG